MRKTVLAAMRRRLRTSRTDAGHTTISLAKRLGTTHSTIVRWEQGDTEPRASDLLRWAESCDVSASWLLCGTMSIVVTPERRESEPRETTDDTLAREASRLRDLDPVER